MAKGEEDINLPCLKDCHQNWLKLCHPFFDLMGKGSHTNRRGKRLVSHCNKKCGTVM